MLRIILLFQEEEGTWYKEYLSSNEIGSQNHKDVLLGRTTDFTKFKPKILHLSKLEFGKI
jgi:hypothetical protein